MDLTVSVTQSLFQRMKLKKSSIASALITLIIVCVCVLCVTPAVAIIFMRQTMTIII